MQKYEHLFELQNHFPFLWFNHFPPPAANRCAMIIAEMSSLDKPPKERSSREVTALSS